MWQTARQVRLEERERRLYSPGETGLILTYAPEWNEDWHDLLIWAVTAHDGHRRSPVTLLPARRTSCHQDRSKIEIHFVLREDSNWATGPDFHLSLYLPQLYLPASCCSLHCNALKSHNSLQVLPAFVCSRLGASYFEGEDCTCCFPLIQKTLLTSSGFLLS